MGMDLDNAQKETRNISSELFRVKNAYDEAILQLEEVRRENKVLSNEIKDIMDQISAGGRPIHEIDKIRKRLEGEKLELQTALEEAESMLMICSRIFPISHFFRHPRAGGEQGAPLPAGAHPGETGD